MSDLSTRNLGRVTAPGGKRAGHIQLQYHRGKFVHAATAWQRKSWAA